MNSIATENKITTLKKLLPVVKRLRTKKKRIVTTNGCFDILHPGHVSNLEWARNQGDVLIVGINSDASVQKNKGPKRPIMNERDRARVLAGQASVDYVFIFNEATPSEWIVKIRPHIHVKGRGSENAPALKKEKKKIEEGGGELKFAPYIPHCSTTNVITSIIRRYKK